MNRLRCVIIHKGSQNRPSLEKRILLYSSEADIIFLLLDYTKKAHVLPVYPTGDYDNDMLPFIEILKDVIPKIKVLSYLKNK